jgi:hypothetical protein
MVVAELHLDDLAQVLEVLDSSHLRWPRHLCGTLLARHAHQMQSSGQTERKPSSPQPIPPPPLTILGARTFISMVASSSQTMSELGWCWRAEAVHMWLNPFSTTWCIASALDSPVTSSMTSRASRTVPTPTVTDCNVGAQLHELVKAHFFYGSKSLVAHVINAGRPPLVQSETRVPDTPSWGPC